MSLNRSFNRCLDELALLDGKDHQLGVAVNRVADNMDEMWIALDRLGIVKNDRPPFVHVTTDCRGPTTDCRISGPAGGGAGRARLNEALTLSCQHRLRVSCPNLVSSQKPRRLPTFGGAFLCTPGTRAGAARWIDAA